MPFNLYDCVLGLVPHVGVGAEAVARFKGRVVDFIESVDEIAEMGQVIYDSGKRLERLIENFLIYGQLELIGADPQKLHSLLRKQTPQPSAVIDKHARIPAGQFCGSFIAAGVRLLLSKRRSTLAMFSSVN